MAKRYGGKFSPDEIMTESQTPRGNFDRARVDPAGARSNVLFIPAIVLVFVSLNDGAVGLTLGLVAAAFLTLAAWLLRDGLRAEAVYKSRKVARRPAFPRKMAASVLTGIGVALAAFQTEFVSASGSLSFAAPVLYGVVAMILHSVSFGFDPMKDKGMDGIDTFQQDRVARVVGEAEKHLAAMGEAIARAGDRKLESRVEAFQNTARDLIRTVEEDPRDLTAVRKYLGVYLRGASDATEKFADVFSRTRDAKARSDYANLLDDLDQNFAYRTRKSLLNDRSDLNIEIDVLRDRLQREGVSID
ncbi:MAG: 5-bromo-4-chloroindolyl phosphate hydrolysis family protein [Paracoccaceae bacterium]